MKIKHMVLHIMPDHICSVPKQSVGCVCTNTAEQPLSVAINTCSSSPQSCLPATLWAQYPDVYPPREAFTVALNQKQSLCLKQSQGHL